MLRLLIFMHLTGLNLKFEAEHQMQGEDFGAGHMFNEIHIKAIIRTS